VKIVVRFCQQELVEEDIDWWSKFYASIGDYDKSGDYIERGYDKMIVRQKLGLLVLSRVVVLTFVFEIKLAMSLSIVMTTIATGCSFNTYHGTSKMVPHFRLQS